jgi:Tfp pilus assembly pilus retraction ATPase PilT
MGTADKPGTPDMPVDANNSRVPDGNGNGTRARDGNGTGNDARDTAQKNPSTTTSKDAPMDELEFVQERAPYRPARVPARIEPVRSFGHIAPVIPYPWKLTHTVTAGMCNRLLLWAVESRNVSDVVLCPEDPVWIQTDGVWHVCTDIALTRAEVDDLVNAFAGQSQQSGVVRTGRSIDFAYSIREDRGRFRRFRVNVTNSSKGAYIVMRALPRDLPRLEDLGLEDSLRRAIFPPNGLVVVSGVMGSGKSTLLAGVVHAAIREKGRQVLTLEEPIEFDFSQLPAHLRTAPIAQSAVGQHVESWSAGVRTLTRRKGEIVMVGEARDRETLESMIGAVEQGVTAYSTVHAQDVPQTVTRIVNAFPEDERPSVAAVLAANLRVVIHQRLVPRVAGDGCRERGVPGRIALREFLVFDESIRRICQKTPYAEFIPVVRRLVDSHGQSLMADAEAKWKAGLIDGRTMDDIANEMRAGKDGGDAPVSEAMLDSGEGSTREVMP